MRLETAKYLYDVQSAATALAGFVDGCDWAGYQSNAMLRAAVERQFEIIGEALPSSAATTWRCSRGSNTTARSSRSATS